MLKAEAANESESADDGKPACRVEDILDPGGTSSPGSEQRQAETKDQVTECLQPHGKALTTSLGSAIHHGRTLP